jgi:hypothetical protein
VVLLAAKARRDWSHSATSGLARAHGSRLPSHAPPRCEGSDPDLAKLRIEERDLEGQDAGGPERQRDSDRDDRDRQLSQIKTATTAPRIRKVIVSSLTGSCAPQRG